MASPPQFLANSALPRLRRRLIDWFDRHARDLPWRRTRSPYAIWISEVMLQQTQVATVIPYFERFLAAYPDVQSLARAEETEVLQLWQGLGYYRRARDIHRAAQVIVADHGGVWPSDPRAAARLPGIGRYTMNAILSQAFDQRLPILEANSRRVLCRLGAVKEDPRQRAVDKMLWQWAEMVLPRARCGDFNQALMELGALVCTSEKPRCAICPLRSLCQARREARQHEIPVRRSPMAIEQVRELALVVRHERRVLLVQRPATGRWASMWEFPHIAWEDGDDVEATAARLLGQLGLEADMEGHWGIVRHGVTRFRITLHCHGARLRTGAFHPGLYVAARWLSPACLADVALSSPQRRLAAWVAGPRQAELALDLPAR